MLMRHRAGFRNAPLLRCRRLSPRAVARWQPALAAASMSGCGCLITSRAALTRMRGRVNVLAKSGSTSSPRNAYSTELLWPRLAVQAVQHEPFSRGNSLLTGKFGGNSGQSLLGNREERPVRQHFSGVGAA